MKSLMIEQTQGDLASSLSRIAANPEMVSALHEIMGGFCHQCRNILNSLKLSLYLANRDASASTIPGWSDLEGRYRSVELLFDRLQTLCRPMNLSSIHASLALVVQDRSRAWTEAMATRGRTLTLVPPTGSDVGDFDPVRLPEALDAFVLWRSHAGEPGQPATLCWAAVDDRFELTWSEPSAWGLGETGAGGPPDRADALALPLLARVISAHRGSLTLSLRDGLHLGACWPLVARPT